MFYVYVIKNDFDKIYIGQTINLDKRLLRHNGALKSKNRSYTKINNGVWKAIYKETYNTRQEAIKRERYLKSHSGRDWLRRKILGP